MKPRLTKLCWSSILVVAGTASAFELKPVEFVPLTDLPSSTSPVLDFGSEADLVSLSMFQEAEEAQAVPEPLKPTGKWNLSVRAGANGSWGNSDTQSVFASFAGARETTKTKFDFFLGYYFAANSGSTSENRFTASVLNEWKLPKSPKWIIWASGRFDYDQFQSWRYRIQGHAGPGYIMVKTDNFTLTWRLGGGVTKEFEADNDAIMPEAVVGFEFNWQINERQRLLASSTIYPDLGNLGQFRTYSFIDWSVKIDQVSGMSLAFRFEHDYQSIVNPGFDRNDYRLLVGIQFDW